MDNRFTVLNPEKKADGKIKAAVFDFDGTISTLRCGWERVMRPLMLEMISGNREENITPELEARVDEYIEESTGIQTIYQMKWLCEQVYAAGFGESSRDEWWYKEEYNRRLMQQVEERISALEKGELKKEDFIIAGAKEFLSALKEKGVDIYLASGTDHNDVVREAEALGVRNFFREIKGAPEHMVSCSKEAVIKMILSERSIPADELLLVGDGKVEIKLGKDAGAFTLGAATDEKNKKGFNPVKENRLVKAGADAITGDFTSIDSIMSWLGY